MNMDIDDEHPMKDESLPPPPFKPQARLANTDLPPNWKYARDSAGDVYYYNTVTKQTQWNPPTISEPEGASGPASQDSDMSEKNDSILVDTPKGKRGGTPGILSVQVTSGGSFLCTLSDSISAKSPVPVRLTSVKSLIPDNLINVNLPVQKELTSTSGSVNSTVHEELSSVKSPVNKELTSVNSPVNEELTSVNNPVHEELTSMNSQFHEEISSVDSPVQEELPSVYSPSPEEVSSDEFDPQEDDKVTSSPLDLTENMEDDEATDQDCSEIPDSPHHAGGEFQSETIDDNVRDAGQVLNQEYRGGTFKCSRCAEVFSSEIDVSGHECSHVINRMGGRYQCQVCDKTYRWKKDLIIHENNARAHGPFECPVCGKTFCTKGVLAKHERSHFDDRKSMEHTCQVCGKVYRWKKDLIIHMKNVQNQAPLRCSVCAKAFCTKRDLGRHFNDHVFPSVKSGTRASGSNPLPIKVPTATLSTPGPVFKMVSADSVKTALVSSNPIVQTPSSVALASPVLVSKLTATSRSSHDGKGDQTLDQQSKVKDKSAQSDASYHFKVEGQILACRICGKVYRWKKDLNIHIANREEPFDCTSCTRQFCTKTDLVRHAKRQHPDLKLFKCTSCEKEFARKAGLKNHVRNAHQPRGSDRVFKCEECEKTYCSSRQLKAHSLLHSGEVQFKCTYCEKNFTTQAHLTVHVRIHTGEKPFQCAVCGKCFISNGELTLHTRVHTGEKPFICSYCQKAFSGSCRLLLHVRSIHTHEKPYLCSFCAKAFVSSAQMKKHMRVHTGEKPYKCSHCDKWFSQQSARKTHEYIHTGERPFVCSLCKKSFTQKGLLTVHVRKCTGPHQPNDEEMDHLDSNMSNEDEFCPQEKAYNLTNEDVFSPLETTQQKAEYNFGAE